MKKINEVFIMIIFSIIISSCSALPKRNPDKTDTILIVPVSVTNTSKQSIDLPVQFEFRKVDDGSKHHHIYVPKVDDSYLILTHLKPGNYKFLRVYNSKNSKIGKDISSDNFIMADNSLTIIQDQFDYKQTVRGGFWYTYNINTSYLNKDRYNKLIEKLENNM